MFHRTNGGNDEVESARAITLMLEAAIADLAQAVEKDGARQGVFSLAFVEPSVNAPAQLDVLQPVQCEEGALDLPDFPQRHRQAVLARITAELAQHERRGHRAVLDRRHQA